VNRAPKHQRLWAAYLVFAALAAAVGILSDLRAALADGVIWRVGLGAIVTALYLIPLYGYVQQRKISPRWLWWVVLIVAGVAVITGFVVAGFFALYTGNLLPGLAIAGIAVCLAPNLFAIHQYVRNRQIWHAT
jgi:hypothetical protein